MSRRPTKTAGLRRAGPDQPGRGAVLGGVLAAAAATGTLTLGRAALQTWPGTGRVDPEAALLTVTLATATTLLGWVSTVLVRAALDLLGPACRPRPGPGPARPWAVRWASATLVAVTASPATVALAGPPDPAWTSASARAAVDETAATAGTTRDDDTSATPHSAPGAPAPVDSADPGEPGHPVQPADPAQPLLLPDGSPVPEPAWTPAPALAAREPSVDVGLLSASPRDCPSAHAVVRRGDTLWAIAARHLGPGSTVQDVAQEWPRWYAANRDLIGPDPDLILPGQELVAPGPEVDR